jgi:Right handed beta helix region
MNVSFVSRILLFALLGLGASAQLHAQSPRTWVSGVGDDANPCSRTAPCKTFPGAISKTAAGGEINCLDPGGFGTVTITKSITIDCSNGGGIAGIQGTGTNGIIVNGSGVDVIVRNLDINGMGSGLDGIKYLQGRALHVENCRIYGFTGQGINFQPTANTNSLFVSGTKLNNNTGGGIAISTVGTNAAVIKGTLTDTIMQRNGRGLFVGDNSHVTVYNSIATDNTGDGFVANGTSHNPLVIIEAGTSSLNGSNGINALAVSGIRIGRMQISGNGVGLNATGSGVIQTFGNNDVTGNGTATTGNAPVPISSL